ncbi:N-acetylglucosaminyltransferase family protein [Klebsormidium nitens]|uniref:procollagen-lysine 5-dioxygenase n=1 Tax=Klebsormidium nitens TaxID=105231 RepID=A0A0U9HKK6_KLENI|nr:N-acetylglucosaminyltransferase family protein [Klebsormidium nitens]|eukprot:GAQ88896.1 N-acetylglucosaminyltransferase family protein [Klebsormidium nitens]
MMGPPVRAISDLPDVCQLRILSLLEKSEQPLKSATSLNNGGKGPAGEVDSGPEASFVQEAGTSKSVFQWSHEDSPLMDAVDTLARSGYALVQGAVTKELVTAARSCADCALEGEMTAAKMGGGAETQWIDQHFRGDRRMWLKPAQVLQPGWESFQALTQMLLRLKQPLQEAGYDVSGPVSFQLACYPGGGAGYVRHRDRSPSSPHRTVTVLYYLNPEWTPNDGGQLRLFLKDGASIDLPPMGGNVVLFESGMEHEVLPAHAKRFAVTAWFSEGAKQDASESGGGCSGQEAQAEGCSNTGRTEPTVPSKRGDCLNGLGKGSREAGDNPALETTSQKTSTHAVNTIHPSAPHPPLTGPSHSLSPAQRIFVSLVCYRDSECRWTVKDLFRKADLPGRVWVGIVWQIDERDDCEFAHLRGLDEDARKRVREVRVDWREATGPCWARHRAQQLWDGEEFFLQIDSHMRFAPQWDTKLLAALAAAETRSPKAVLSSYPPPYEGLGAAASIPEDSRPTFLCAKEFGPDGLLRMTGRRAESRGGEPVRSAFWAAGFSFSRSAVIQEVPYSPHLPELFFGEEMIMAVRLFTHGWDVYAPPEALVFHQWSREHRPFFRESRKPDLKARAASERQVKSFLCTERKEGGEVCSLCGAPPADSYSREYGLGDVRCVRSFAEACSVNFCRKRIGRETEEQVFSTERTIR